MLQKMKMECKYVVSIIIILATAAAVARATMEIEMQDFKVIMEANRQLNILNSNKPNLLSMNRDVFMKMLKFLNFCDIMKMQNLSKELNMKKHFCSFIKEIEDADTGYTRYEQNTLQNEVNGKEKKLPKFIKHFLKFKTHRIIIRKNILEIEEKIEGNWILKTKLNVDFTTFEMVIYSKERNMMAKRIKYAYKCAPFDNIDLAFYVHTKFWCTMFDTTQNPRRYLENVFLEWK